MTGPRQRLDELDAAREAATPGPWFAWDRGVGWHLAVEDPTGVNHLPGRPHLVPEGSRTDLARAEDAALIVAAVNALPVLTSALRAVADLADELDEAAKRADDAEPVTSDDLTRMILGARFSRDHAARIRAVLAPLAAPNTADETT